VKPLRRLLARQRSAPRELSEAGKWVRLEERRPGLPAQRVEYRKAGFNPRREWRASG
jgi:hypothetical protein